MMHGKCMYSPSCTQSHLTANCTKQFQKSKTWTWKQKTDLLLLNERRENRCNVFAIYPFSFANLAVAPHQHPKMVILPSSHVCRQNTLTNEVSMVSLESLESALPIGAIPYVSHGQNIHGVTFSLFCMSIEWPMLANRPEWHLAMDLTWSYYWSIGWHSSIDRWTRTWYYQ